MGTGSGPVGFSAAGLARAPPGPSASQSSAQPGLAGTNGWPRSSRPRSALVSQNPTATTFATQSVAACLATCPVLDAGAQRPNDQIRSLNRGVRSSAHRHTGPAARASTHWLCYTLQPFDGPVTLRLQVRVGYVIRSDCHLCDQCSIEDSRLCLQLPYVTISPSFITKDSPHGTGCRSPPQR